MSKEAFLQNRELSWLKFDERCMDEAMDKSVPLLERLRFLSIFTTNLDEFYRVRVGSLIDLLPLGDAARDSKSKMTPAEQLRAIYDTTRQLYQKRDALFAELTAELKEYGVEYLTFRELTPEEQSFAEDYFSGHLMPVLSPQIVDKLHPFPQLQNKDHAVGVMLKSMKGESVPALLVMPHGLPDILCFPGSPIRFVTMDEILYEFADAVFTPYKVVEKVKLCVTRNADIHAEDEDLEYSEDFRDLMEKMLKDRRHLAPLRLELSHRVSSDSLKFLTHRLGIKKSQVFVTESPLSMGFAYSLENRLSKKQKETLLYPPYEPRIPKTVDPGRQMLDQLKRHDILLSYPYESMEPFLRLVEEAADDRDVVSVQITIYRLAKQSRLVTALCRAAENRKDVTVLMELRARFDEQNNINWSEILEQAGCNVIYGTPNYKVHSKLCLITRRENGRYRYYTQAGTGNYNEKTAKLYTDLCLMTSNPEVGAEASLFFRNMGIGNLYGNYQELLVSPVTLKKTVIELIDRETRKGSNGYLFFKINSLTDKDIMQKLHEASCAGVTVKMIVRGITCLIPGVPGKTENIEIHSIVGRYLEHSRIYIFGTGESEKVYIASADFMTRNTERRVEIGCPVLDESVKARIHEIVRMLWSDNQKARVITADGGYEKIGQGEETAEPFNAQEAQMNLAEENGYLPEDRKALALGRVRRARHRWSLFAKKK